QVAKPPHERRIYALHRSQVGRRQQPFPYADTRRVDSAELRRRERFAPLVPPDTDEVEQLLADSGGSGHDVFVADQPRTVGAPRGRFDRLAGGSVPVARRRLDGVRRWVAPTAAARVPRERGRGDVTGVAYE